MGNKAIVNHTSPALRTPIHSFPADPICSERVAIHCEWEENPQNCPFPLGFRHSAIHDHRQHAQKIGKDRACGYGENARGQTDTQTDRQTIRYIYVCAKADCYRYLNLPHETKKRQKCKEKNRKQKPI